MSLNTQENTLARDNFVFVATELISMFPELDLRFNFQNGKNRLRFMVASISRDIIELELQHDDPTKPLVEAIFEIKERAKLFDD